MQTIIEEMLPERASELWKSDRIFNIRNTAPEKSFLFSQFLIWQRLNPNVNKISRHMNRC
jgi:hypothetical protein